MKLVVGSCFRDPTPDYVANYRKRIADLHRVAVSRGDTLELVTVWGDSARETPELLGLALGSLGLPRWTLVDRTHGKGVFGSTTHPDRLAGFAYAVNGVYESIGPDVDAVIYVESDLVWDAGTLYRLVDQLRPGVDVLAPMIMLAKGVHSWIGISDGKMFYDIWGCRDLLGGPFQSYAPYTETLVHDGLTEISTVGSCVVSRGEVARKCRATEALAIVGFSLQARAHEYRVWIDARERIDHP